MTGASDVAGPTNSLAVVFGRTKGCLCRRFQMATPSTSLSVANPKMNFDMT